jgi:polar amino acid transport system substrate-binding protein
MVALCMGIVIGACTLGGGGSSTPANAQSGEAGVLISPTLAQIKSSGTMRDCIDPEFPPESFLDSSGNPTGLDIDLATALAKALNVKISFVKTDFAGLLAGVEAGKCDIQWSGTTPRAARALVTSFAKDTLVATVGLLVRTTETRTSIAALNQSDVKFCDQEGTLAQTAQQEYFPKVQATNLTAADQCVLDVLSGRADATIVDSTSALGYSEAHPQLKSVLFENGGLAAAPTAPSVRLGDFGFTHFIDVWFREFVDNGNYTPLYVKYFHVNPDIQELLIQRGGL